MRQIDADALLDTLKFLANRSYNRKLTTSYSNAYKECMEFVKRAPTVGPKHGHWINTSISANGHEYSYEAECDLCGARVHNNFSSVINYCPRCGAKMDEDEWQEPEEPNINPCRGCDDYDGQGGCKSNGGCGTWIRMDEVK